jgi:hypothetical protein
MMERQLILRNEKDELMEATIRPYSPGDEYAMIDCIRDEYNGTYFDRNLYNPAYYPMQEMNGGVRFFVAESEYGGVIGMILLKQSGRDEDICEIASQIFRKKYRGYRLSMPFLEYVTDIIRNENYPAAYCLPVMFHDITQRSLKCLGFHATGVILNVFDVNYMVHSFDNGRNCKHSQGIQVKPLGRKNAGTVYIPAKHKLFVAEIYRKLGVSCRISDKKPGIFRRRGEIPEKSVIAFKQDSIQKNLEIRIHLAGLDLKRRVKELHYRFPLKGNQTAGVFLNCTDSNAVWAYEVLCRMGYFFCGMRPLCGEKEYMVMHNPGDVKIMFKDYRANEEFRELLDYVEVCCSER